MTLKKQTVFVPAEGDTMKNDGKIKEVADVYVLTFMELSQLLNRFRHQDLQPFDYLKSITT